jgi:hypothetical protein
MDRLQTWDQFEQRQRQLDEMRRQRDMECVSCPQCGSQFFERVDVVKIKADHNVILGQKPDVSSGPYIILRCIHCQGLLEPRIINHTRDVMGGDYDVFLDTVEGKLDERKKKEDQPGTVEDAIQSQKL